MEQQLDIFGALYEEYKITKPIRLIEFFAGYGSQNLALKYLGANYESWKICEWATKSIQAYNDLHHEDYTDYSMVYSYQEILDFLYNKGISMNYNNPMTLEQIKRKGEKWCRNVFNNIIATNNLVNIQQVSGKDLNIVDTDKYDYVLTYSFPCVLAGYKVKAINGYKNIEDINTNDFVLTHTNNYKKVVKTMTRKKEGYYKIKYLGGTLELTDEHPMYVLRNDKFQWVKVKDLKLTDKLTINVNKESIDVEYDNKLLWMLGRYVADGHYNKYTYNSINFSISFEKEEEFLKNIPNEFVAKFKKYKKKCWDYRIADKNFKELCLQFNTGSKNKIIPQWVLDLPKDKLQSFFDGYIAGDGYTRYRGNNKQIMFSTVSQNVFLAMQDIVLKLYGKVCSQYIREDKRDKNYNNSYQAQVTLNENNKFQFIKEDKACVRIKEILFINEEVDVYNFEVEQDNSYTVNNIIVHNCQDLSLAGKRAGMGKGENTRSGMLWEVERILKELCGYEEPRHTGKNTHIHDNGLIYEPTSKIDTSKLPKILLLENVTQLHSKENMPHLQAWLRELEKLGYSSYWQDMNSADYGVPQHRDRTFVVSILGDYYYEFPKKFPLKLVLADMLEDEVDEKYYLSEKMIKYISERGTGGFANADCRINLEVARPITTDPNKRAGTTNYLCNDLPSGFDLNSLCIKIPEATKKGYAKAYEGDGVYINRPHQKRGCVQKGLNQTLKTSPDDVGVVVRVGNYSPSGHNASTVVDSRGIAPTVMENHGTVTAIVENNGEPICLNSKGGRNGIEGLQPSLQDRIYSSSSSSVAITTSFHPSYTDKEGLRIRKLSPKECGRLMGVRDSDIDKMSKNQSNSSLYHLFGDSIVVDVLMNIFKKLL